MTKSYNQIQAKNTVKEMLKINEKIKTANPKEKEILYQNFIKLDNYLKEIGEFENLSIYHNEIKNSN